MGKNKLVLDILQRRGRVVAFYPDLARAVGSVKAGLLLSQLLYWSRGTEWICKTQEEIQERTSLSRQEQETARALLKELGILEEKYRGMPRRLYFRINTDRLLQVLEKELQGRQGSPNGEGCPDSVALSECEFSANKNASFPQTRMRVFRKQGNSQVSVAQAFDECLKNKNKKKKTTKKKKNTSCTLAVKQVVEVFNRIANRCKEYKPVEALTPSLKARIWELMETDSKFENPYFWEKLFLRGRDIVIRVNESRDVSNSRTLGWVLKDGVLEMILGDVGTEEHRMVVPKENMRRFKEYVEGKGYDWELLLKELKVYVPKVRKKEEGFVFATSSLIGRRIVYALASGDFQLALSMFALTSKTDSEKLIASQSSEGGA